MRKLVSLIGIVILSVGSSLAQKGTAEPDYYPQNYSGDTWTGVVTSVNEDTRELTLIYKKKDKEETFIGVLPKEYTHKMADGKYQQIKLADLMGMTIRAYYMSKTKKVNDQKIKYNDVFKIKILALAKPGP
jgi:hypothetical protein